MKHNVSYKLEKRKDNEGAIIESNVPLFADITYSGTRMFYFTGYRIDASNWKQGDKKHRTNEDQQAIRNTSATEGTRKVSASDVNRRLRLIKAELTTIFDNTNTTPSKSEVISKLDIVCKKGEQTTTEGEGDPFTFLPAFTTYIQNARLSEGRKRHAESTVNHWQRFADKHNLTLTFDSITPDLLRTFEGFLLSEKKEVSEGVFKAVRGLNTLHTTFAITRTFWNHARKELKEQGILLQYPFESYKVPAEVYGTPIYLTQDERNSLFNAKIEIERLARIRDIFVFQCLTGARVGDLCKLTKDNIRNGVLSYIPRKTKEGKPVTVTVPLSPKAIEIISRYNILDGRLFPFITDQRYNDYIKELFEVVGLKRIVTRQHPTTRESENVRLCDIASSHMARRSFVGTLFGKVDSAIIASMSGHVNNSKAFARYYDVSKELQQQAINLID